VANFPGLYRHSRSGLYYACKKLHGVRREQSLQTCDRKIAERRLKEWIGNMDKVDAEVEKTTLDQLIQRYVLVTASLSESSRATDRSIIKKFLAWWPHGRDFQVRQVRPSMLDEWLAHEAPRLRNVSYNGYTGFLKQLFDIAVKDRILAESPARSLRVPWKKPQTPKRIVPTVEQFQAIVDSIRSQQYADTSQDSGDFIEFLGLAGVGQAEASSLTWGDIDWTRSRVHFRRHKTDTRFYVPIYAHLRPLLERMRQERRGRASASARVFKIKDAKKALSAACQRLKLPHFSQRNLRQSLIRRLIRAKVDVKSISKWQGHQDGGQLILDTYTEVFGDDDDAYERMQLAKISGGEVAAAAPVAQFCGDREADAPSTSMKKRMKKAHPRASVKPAASVFDR
jgi:integrase